MISAFVKAFQQLPETTFRGVLIKSSGLAVVVFAALSVLAWPALSELDALLTDWLGWLPDSWIEGIVSWISGIAVLAGYLVLATVLFAPVVSIFISLFLEEIAGAVEGRHYASEPPAPGQPLGEAMATSLKFFVVMVVANIVVLPIYLLMIWLPLINVFIFYGLNGYLLSREYFELVSMRRLDAVQATALQKAHRGRLLGAGVVITFLFTIPLLNLLAPLLATAAMVHLFQGFRAPPGSQR
jgi:uncharacterized protein involved in cysteine biosynthesis